MVAYVLYGLERAPKLNRRKHVVHTVEDNPGERGAERAVRVERCQLRWIREAQTDREAHELGVTESLRTGRSGGRAQDGCRVTGMGGIIVRSESRPATHRRD